jgi:predicted transcriptional regulator
MSVVQRVGRMEGDATGVAYRSVLGWGNRGWLEIIDLILSVCDQGALKTHVMYKCNLNSKQVQQYLDFALSRSLVEASRDSQDVKRMSYTTTERGRRFMRAYDDLADIFSLQNKGLGP